MSSSSTHMAGRASSSGGTPTVTWPAQPVPDPRCGLSKEQLDQFSAAVASKPGDPNHFAICMSMMVGRSPASGYMTIEGPFMKWAYATYRASSQSNLTWNDFLTHVFLPYSTFMSFWCDTTPASPPPAPPVITPPTPTLQRSRRFNDGASSYAGSDGSRSTYRVPKLPTEPTTAVCILNLWQTRGIKEDIFAKYQSQDLKDLLSARPMSFPTDIIAQITDIHVTPQNKVWMEFTHVDHSKAFMLHMDQVPRRARPRCGYRTLYALPTDDDITADQSILDSIHRRIAARDAPTPPPGGSAPTVQHSAPGNGGPGSTPMVGVHFAS